MHLKASYGSESCFKKIPCNAAGDNLIETDS